MPPKRKNSTVPVDEVTDMKVLLQDQLKEFAAEWGLKPPEERNKVKDGKTFDEAITDLEAYVVENLESLEKRMTKLEERMSVIGDRMRKRDREVEDRQDEGEQYSRRNCLLLHGVPEVKDENTDRLVLHHLQKVTGNEVKITDLDRTHRLGPRKSAAEAVKSGNRPIIIKFVSYRVRKMVYDRKKALKGSGLVITESLTRLRMEWYRTVKDKVGQRNVWTLDGTIYCVVDERLRKIRSGRDMDNMMAGYESLVKETC